jgi:primosomal protein N' (replication factor Y)
VGKDAPQGRPEVSARSVTPRVVQVLPDVSAIDRVFDYEVPDKLSFAVRVGAAVRVELHGRRVRGWVVAEGRSGADYDTLKPILKVSPGWVQPESIDMAEWAAWRWAGKRRSFLATAADPHNYREPVSFSGARERGPEQPSWGDAAFAHERAVLRLAPAIDPWPVIEAAARRGPALVLVPSLARVERLARRINDDPVGHVVVGSRAGAWAPMRQLGAVVVVDAHDEVYAEERAPTWNAWRVAAERAERAGASCVLVSATPTLEHLEWGTVVETDRPTERRGWARLEVVDRRGDDPRTGLWSSRVIDAIRGAERALCVLNRTGRAKLLACARCATITTCEKCAAAVRQDEAAVLLCDRCGTTRPALCLECGGTKLKLLRIGTARAAEELSALLGRAVGEVTGASADVPNTATIVGTEALLHRVGRADLVVFVDLDAELSAPRYRANEEALGLLARASRVVRGRNEDGLVLVQTRQPDHPVLKAAVASDPARLNATDAAMRSELRLPPFAAVAQVSGEAADAFVDQLRGQLGVDVLGPDNHDAFLVRADDHRGLCDALARVERPTGRLRVAVDPVRI